MAPGCIKNDESSVGGSVLRMAIMRFTIDGSLDLRRTLRPLGLMWSVRNGDGWWKAMRTPDGPVTVRIWRDDSCVAAEAFGPGSEWAVHRIEGLVGLDDEGHAWASHHPKIADLQHRYPGVRFGRTELVFEAAVYAIVAQKVTGKEAAAGLRGITGRFSGPAPGPLGNLRLPPDPDRMAASPYHDFHDLGIEKKRADTLRRLSADSGRVDRLAGVDVPAAMRYLARIRGVGEWTVNETLVVSHGHADAVSVGDYHLKHIVSWQLAGEARGTDERMLELLEPFRPNRGRVVRLLELAGGPQRKGPRLSVRGFETF